MRSDGARGVLLYLPGGGRRGGLYMRVIICMTTSGGAAARMHGQCGSALALFAGIFPSGAVRQLLW